MEALISIIIIIASALLIFVVFIQNPKGGGLSSDFGAAQQIGGVQKTNDFIDKATWSLAGIIAVLSIVITVVYHKSDFRQPTEDAAAATTEQTTGAPADGASTAQPGDGQ